MRPKITLLKGMPNIPLKIRKIHAIWFFKIYLFIYFLDPCYMVYRHLEMQ